MTFALKTKLNIQNFMRQAGYFFDREENGETAFIRPLTASGSGYPRFHIYLKFDNVSREALRQGSGQATISLHLDQKKPIYRGVSAHAGEYRGELVEKEAERIKQILGP
jgi:hypothetical protein